MDLGALQLRNENIRAVGNMNVNARGDLIDSRNRPIRSRNDQVAKQYRKQTTNVSDAPVVSSRRATHDAVPTPPEDFQDDFVRSNDVSPTAAPGAAAPAAAAAAPASGLAAAIARAREIRQDQVQTPTNRINKL